MKTITAKELLALSRIEKLRETTSALWCKLHTNDAISNEYFDDIDGSVYAVAYELLEDIVSVSDDAEEEVMAGFNAYMANYDDANDELPELIIKWKEMGWVE
jgi:hypothetical protein